MKKKLKSFWLRLRGLHICQHEGCLKVGMQCHLNDYDYEGDYHWKGDLYYWYCPEHCHIEGFCYGCGEFWGGNEYFDFNKSGLCENCQSELDDEADYDEEYDYVPGEIP